MTKKCKSCGAELCRDAAFCPHCETPQTEKLVFRQPPRRYRWALIVSIILVIAAGVMLALSLRRQPVTYEGGADIIYAGPDGTYRLFLCFDSRSITERRPQDFVSVEAAAGSSYAKPSLLSIYDSSTGAAADEAFFKNVSSLSVETIPDENSPAMDFSAPAKNEVFPNAVLVSNIHFDGNSGTNTVRWTFVMKNGDKIILKQTISAVLLESVSFSPENAHIDTLGELSELLAMIKNEFSPSTVIDIYLPPVCYDGELTISGRTVNLYAGSDGQNRTTFTGTLSIEDIPGQITVAGVIFTGSGGDGLRATSAVRLVDCEFSGWDTAVTANDGSWITLTNCLLSGNGTGLHFNSSICSATGHTFSGNTFSGNGTAVLLSRVPGDFPIDFADCVFSGNEVDIDNRTSCTADISSAVFS